MTCNLVVQDKEPLVLFKRKGVRRFSQTIISWSVFRTGMWQLELPTNAELNICNLLSNFQGWRAGSDKCAAAADGIASLINMDVLLVSGVFAR